MDCKQRLILDAIFTDPVPPTLDFGRFEEMLWQLKCMPLGGSGGRVRFMRSLVMVTMQRSEGRVRPYQVEDVREFLVKAGVAR